MEKGAAFAAPFVVGGMVLQRNRVQQLVVVLAQEGLEIALGVHHIQRADPVGVAVGGGKGLLPLLQRPRQPQQLPAITSDLQRGTADLIYKVTPRISLGLTYWYDKYNVKDFTLDSQAQDARIPGNYMLLGYRFEP